MPLLGAQDVLIANEVVGSIKVRKNPFLPGILSSIESAAFYRAHVSIELTFRIASAFQVANLIALAGKTKAVCVACDDADNVAAISAAAAAAGVTIAVLVCTQRHGVSPLRKMCMSEGGF